MLRNQRTSTAEIADSNTAKRPDLTKHIKSFKVVPSIVAEKSDLDFNDTPFNGIVYVTESNLENDLVEEPIEDKGYWERRELEMREECRVLLPKIQQIIESAWTNLHPRLVLGTWLRHMVENTHSLDYSLALVLTLATNLGDLKIRVPSYSNIVQVYMLLQYHRTIEEVASRRAYPFCKLKESRGIVCKLPRRPDWPHHFLDTTARQYRNL